jgi:HEAT repeat protein
MSAMGQSRPTAMADASMALSNAPAEAPPLTTVREQAVQIVLGATRSEDALLRTNAVEASQWMGGRALPVCQLALQDEHPAVRFSALYVLGKLKLLPPGSSLNAMLDGKQPPFVEAAAIYAAARGGKASDAMIGRLGRYVFHSDPSVRANAVMLLGELGNNSAVAMLRQAAQRPEGDRNTPIRWALLRLQTAEAQFKLGEGKAIDSIRGSCYSGLDEVRILAVQTLGRLDDRAMAGNLVNFLADNPVEFRLAAADALARMGNITGLPVILEGASFDVPTVRAQAAFALGHASQRPDARGTLIRLLDDSDPAVRLAAAAAVLEVTN